VILGRFDEGGTVMNAQIDFSNLQPKRQPTRKEQSLYRRWVRYLTDSKLSTEEIHRRAAAFTAAGHKPEDK
jgi:hypothetical protein